MRIKEVKAKTILDSRKEKTIEITINGLKQTKTGAPNGESTGKYEKPASFDTGDHRSRIKEFSDRDIIEKMQENKLLLKQRFKSSQNPVMHGIVNALFSDAPTGCVLLGQRNIQQVDAASRLGDVLSKKDADWVHALYAA